MILTTHPAHGNCSAAAAEGTLAARHLAVARSRHFSFVLGWYNFHFHCRRQKREDFPIAVYPSGGLARV